MKNIVLKQNLVIPAGTVLGRAPSKIELDVESNRECTILGLPIKDSTFTLRLGFDAAEVSNNPLIGWEGDPIEPPSPVAETKKARQTIKDLHDSLHLSGRKSRSRSLALTKLEEASMWLGKDLQELNGTNPYSRSHNSADPVIDAAAPEATKTATVASVRAIEENRRKLQST